MSRWFSGAAMAALFSVASLANAGVDMNHTNPQGSFLVGTPVMGANQRFGGTLTGYNICLIDDFIASGNTIAQVQAAFEENTTDGHLGVTNWHLAVWDSVAAAAASGTDLTGNVINVDLGAGGIYTSLPGTGSISPAWLVDFDGLSIGGLTVGNHYWMALVPDLTFTPYGQEFLLSNTSPDVLGAGTALDSVGINPGGAFGMGPSVPANTNAALFMRTTDQTGAVPGPAAVLPMAFGGLVMALRRRKARKA